MEKLIKIILILLVFLLLNGLNGCATFTKDEMAIMGATTIIGIVIPGTVPFDY